MKNSAIVSLFRDELSFGAIVLAAGFGQIDSAFRADSGADKQSLDDCRRLGRIASVKLPAEVIWRTVAIGRVHAELRV